MAGSRWPERAAAARVPAEPPRRCRAAGAARADRATLIQCPRKSTPAAPAARRCSA
jgi:hypothetical protein